jgi:hypothetical protein
MEASSNSAASKHNTDEKYMAVMKPLQFGKLYCTVDLVLTMIILSHGDWRLHKTWHIDRYIVLLLWYYKF